ncbi:MAG: hypothetical protein ACRCSV_04230, partial [Chlamydiales bacterium]
DLETLSTNSFFKNKYKTALLENLQLLKIKANELNISYETLTKKNSLLNELSLMLNKGDQIEEQYLQLENRYASNSRLLDTYKNIMKVDISDMLNKIDAF